MNILYLSCHSILEYDEVKLLTEMGHNVFSFGAYQNPTNPHDMKRPGFKGFYDDHLQAVAIQCSKENLHEELIEWADCIIVMHKPEWITLNWPKIKHKKVIWRSIGQSSPDIENQLTIARMEGLKVVRYADTEITIPGYVGADALIRFYKDPEEFKGWTGEKEEVVTVAQSMQKRGAFCGFDLFNNITSGLPRKLYGPDNEISNIPGGLLGYEDLKEVYRRSRVYFYTGTYPASYTLNFMEAFMTGVPIVAIGHQLADLKIWPMDTYEVDRFIKNGVNGFISNDKNELRDFVETLLNDHDLAKVISDKGRETAIQLFGKEKIMKEWRDFLESLS